MDKTLKYKSLREPLRMEELLPYIKPLLTEHGRRALASYKQQFKKQPSCLQTKVTEKDFRTMNFKQFMSHLSALQGPPTKYIQSVTSTNKEPSFKVNKRKSLTADGQMQHSTAKHALKIQTNARNLKSSCIPTAINRQTNASSKIPKKSLYLPVQTGVQGMSGVQKMPKTPVIKKSVLNSIKAKNILLKTPNDETFIQTEKEINDLEEKANAVKEGLTQENVADIAPVFERSENVYQYCNKSCKDENSTKSNTILCFDGTLANEKKAGQDDVIASLCHMLAKATIEDFDNNNTELAKKVDVDRHKETNPKTLGNVFSILNTSKEKQLNFCSLELGAIVEAEKQTEDYVKMLDSCVSMLNTIREKQLILLQQLRLLKNEKSENYITEQKRTVEIPLSESKCETPVVNKEKLKFNCSTAIISPIKPPSKPPSYKVRRNSISLRKKLIRESMMNVSKKQLTSLKTDSARNMYMQIKQQMTFLKTPLNERSHLLTSDTPTVISNNLQKQLDKLCED